MAVVLLQGFYVLAGMAVVMGAVTVGLMWAGSSTSYLRCRGCGRVKVFPSFRDYYAWTESDHTGWCPACYLGGEGGEW